MLVVRVVVEALQQQSAARRTALNGHLKLPRVARVIVKQTRCSLDFQVDLAEGMIMMEVWTMIVYGAAENLPRIRSRLWLTGRQRQSWDIVSNG